MNGNLSCLMTIIDNWSRIGHEATGKLFFAVFYSTLIIDASINYNNSHWTSEPQITVCILQWRRHETPVTQGAPSKLPYSEYSPIKKLFRVTSSLQEWLLNLPPVITWASARCVYTNKNFLFSDNERPHTSQIVTEYFNELARRADMKPLERVWDMISNRDSFNLQLDNLQ